MDDWRKRLSWMTQRFDAVKAKSPPSQLPPPGAASQKEVRPPILQKGVGVGTEFSELECGSVPHSTPLCAEIATSHDMLVTRSGVLRSGVSRDCRMSGFTLPSASSQAARAWIAAWRQRTAVAQTPAAVAAAGPARQPLRTPPTLQQDMAIAISQAGAYADSSAPLGAGSQADDSEDSMRAARKGVPFAQPNARSDVPIQS